MCYPSRKEREVIQGSLGLPLHPQALRTQSWGRAASIAASKNGTTALMERGPVGRVHRAKGGTLSVVGVMSPLQWPGGKGIESENTILVT